MENLLISACLLGVRCRYDGESCPNLAVEALMERSLADGKTRTVYVVVGPEGGISDQEIEALTSAGADACILGANILRASTAGPVALSLLSRTLGRFA